MSSTEAVSVITVTWNSGNTIGRVIDGVGTDCELIVVDNGSQDETREIVRGDRRAVLIEPGANLGFGAACNLGARTAAGDVLVFLNPDTHPSPSALAALALQLGDRSVGIVLPALSPSIEAVRETVGAFPSPIFVVAQALGLWQFAKRLYIRPGRRLRIPCGFGACMAMRRELFEEVGGFDESIFLYGEDTDLCRRIRDSGHHVVLDTTILVPHRGNASGEQAFDDADRAALVLQANHRFLERFHSRRYADLTFALWRLVLPLRMWARPDYAAMHLLLKDGSWRTATPRPSGENAGTS